MKNDLLAQVKGLCGPGGCSPGLPKVAAGEDQLQNILAIVFGIVGALAVLTIVIAGFNFATAGTDADKISRSKKAIVYALAGLAIAISAEAIIFTVLGNL